MFGLIYQMMSTLVGKLRASRIEFNLWKSGLKTVQWILKARYEKGCGNGMFWSEIGSGFDEPGGTPRQEIRGVFSEGRVTSTCKGPVTFRVYM